MAILFFAVGGVPWLVWGIAVRVAASVTGHWLVGYFATTAGRRSWHIEGAGVQGYNVPYCGLITMGEAWHNNHHAFPASARLGLRDGEVDPGWWVLRTLQWAGLVWGIKTPEMLPTAPIWFTRLSEVGAGIRHLGAASTGRRDDRADLIRRFRDVLRVAHDLDR